MLNAQLNGFFPQDFQAQGRWRSPVGAPPAASTRSVPLIDARALQAVEGVSEADFLARHGFVLLPHESAVQDWDRDAADVYLPEVEALVRERLFPGRAVEVGFAPLARRGRGTAMPVYAEGVHADTGASLDEHVHNLAAFAGEAASAAWRERYQRDDVLGLVWLNFWRTTNMAQALEHMPLALCEPDSVDPADLAPVGLTGIAPGGRETLHLALRANPAQRWASYPRMTGAEVLAFTLAEFWKAPAPLRTGFHTAFRDPHAPADAELRQSCELRVSVLVLRD